MKYYLADFDIRDGDNEYSLQFLVQAENLADAEDSAMVLLRSRSNAKWV
jgi:hypothetical protein